MRTLHLFELRVVNSTGWESKCRNDLDTDYIYAIKYYVYYFEPRFHHRSNFTESIDIQRLKTQSWLVYKYLSTINDINCLIVCTLKYSLQPRISGNFLSGKRVFLGSLLETFDAFQLYVHPRSVTCRKMAGHGKGREAGKNKRTKKK